MYLAVCIACPARKLFQNSVVAHVRELMEIDVARLLLHVFEVNAPLVDADWCSRFHSCRCDSPSGDAFREMMNGRFCASSTFHHLSSHVHQSVEESAGSNDDALGIEFCTPDGAHADCLSVCYEQLVGLVLPDVEVVGMVEDGSPFPDELATVALSTRTPYGRSLSYIKHTELDSRLVGDDTHLSAQCINLSHNLSLGNTAYGRIATHLTNLVHVHRYQAGVGAHVCRGSCCLASGVPSTDNEYVIIEVHNLCF